MKFSFFFYMLISTANGFTRSHQRFRAKALRLQPRFSTSDRIEHKPIGLLDTEKDTNLLIDTNVNSLSQINSIAILNFVAILWGSQHVCIKSSIDLYESTSILNLWRFTMSTVLFLKPLLEFISKKPDRFDPTLRGGLELGLWTFLGFGCQAIGLETTTAGRSAFLLYLNVKLVPIFARSLYNRPISNQTWLSAALVRRHYNTYFALQLLFSVLRYMHTCPLPPTLALLFFASLLSVIAPHYTLTLSLSLPRLSSEPYSYRMTAHLLILAIYGVSLLQQPPQCLFYASRSFQSLL